MPSIEYYLRDTQTEYYTGGDTYAHWWTPSDGSGTGLGCTDGEVVDDEKFRALCKGWLPDGRLVNRNNGVRRPGFDLHFAPPKSVSIVVGLADESTRRKVLASHDRAVRRVLNYIHKHGYLRARRGHAGAEFEPANSFVAAIFRELTSRENDPQLHSHCVVPNLGMRSDGSVGALNNEELLRYQLLLGALYNAELANGLSRAGFSLVRNKQNFEISGIPAKVIAHFSKRRFAIEEAARAAGIDPSTDRAAAQFLALSTRQKKLRAQPVEILAALWRQKAAELGFDLSGIPRDLKALKTPELTEERASEAVHDAFENSTVLKWPRLLAAVARNLQLETDVDAIERVLSHTLPTTVLAVGDTNELSHRRWYSTPQIIGWERQIVRLCLSGRGRWSNVSIDRIEQAINNLPTLSDEQILAIRHALNRDTVTVVEGSAGAGKSFALNAVAKAARSADLDVYALGPSWAATKVVARDTDTPAQQASALTGFLSDVEAGRIVLGPTSLLLLDEAGMVGTRDMARLIGVVAEASAKLVLSGDGEQLKPVAAGAPLSIVSRAIGSSRMSKIRRQTVGWQRDASELFARGMTTDALTAYDRHGNIQWSTGTTETLSVLADRFVADVLWDQAQGLGEASNCLAIASWNEDVLELNRQIRLRLQAARIISEDKIEVPVGRKTGDKIERVDEALTLAIGDRIAFGETLILPERKITNADAAIVLAANSKSLTVRFDDRQIVTVPWAEAIGRRDAEQPRLPLLKHVFAATVHFAQGMTVDRCYVAATRRMHRDTMYVSMTRHRHNAQLFVDSTRFDESAWKKERHTKALSANGPSLEVSRAQKARFFEECAQPNLKYNVSDFVMDPFEWVDDKQNAPYHRTSLKERMEVRSEKRLKDSAKFEERSVRSGIRNDDYRSIQRDFVIGFSDTLENYIRAWVNWLREQITAAVARPAKSHVFWKTFSRSPTKPTADKKMVRHVFQEASSVARAENHLIPATVAAPEPDAAPLPEPTPFGPDDPA